MPSSQLLSAPLLAHCGKSVRRDTREVTPVSNEHTPTAATAANHLDGHLAF